MSKDVEKAALSYRVPAGLKQALQNLADADRRKLGPYIQLVLEPTSNRSARKARSDEGRQRHCCPQSFP